MMMRVCQISVFMECRQRRRVQILLTIDKINLCPSVYSESSASGNINLTHPPFFCCNLLFRCLHRELFQEVNDSVA